MLTFKKGEGALPFSAKNKKIICVDITWRRTGKEYIITTSLDGGKHWFPKMVYTDKETVTTLYLDAMNNGFKPLDDTTKWIMRRC